MSEETDAGKETPKRIVAIAVDGSNHARAAYKYYVDNIRKDGDKVYLLYCLEINSALHSSNWYSSPYSFNEQMLPTLLEEEKERVKSKLDKFAAWLREDGLPGTVKSVNAESPGPGIVKAVKEIGATFVVMGTRGLGTIRRTIMGSVSDYVLHHSHVPVMICRLENDHHHQQQQQQQQKQQKQV